MRARPLRRLAWFLAAVSSGAPTVSRAADEAGERDAERAAPPLAQRGLQLGARVGYSLPVGGLSGGAALSTRLSDLETASVPIGIDAGYRFSRKAYLGGTLAWGAGISPNSNRTCPATASCFRQNAQLRIDARLYLAPDGGSGWWYGLGAGWEIASFARSLGGSTVTSTLTGPVFADLQIGFDWRRGVIAYGPYFGVAIAEFLTDGVNPSASPVSTWIPDPAIHTWITFGLRGTHGPW